MQQHFNLVVIRTTREKHLGKGRRFGRIECIMKSRNGCGWAALALVVVAILAWWRIRTPPSISGSVPFSQLAPPQQEERRMEAKKLTAQVDELALAARNRQQKPFELVITSEQLNTLLQDRLQSENFPIRDLSAGISPGLLSVQGQIDYKGFNGVVTISGDVQAQDGKLVYHVQSLQVGYLPAPSQWREKVETQITQKLNELLARAPGRIDRVSLEQDKMTLSGITN